MKTKMILLAVICTFLSVNFASAKNTGKLSFKTTAEYVKDNRVDCNGNALPALVKTDSTENSIVLVVDCGKDAGKDANAKADASAKAGIGGSDALILGIVAMVLLLAFLAFLYPAQGRRRGQQDNRFSNDINAMATTLNQGSGIGSASFVDRDEHGNSRSASFVFNAPTTEVIQLRNQTRTATTPATPAAPGAPTAPATPAAQQQV